MSNELTPKQERFAQKYIELGNASEAYRQSYDAGNMKPETINRSAKELMDNPKIAARVAEILKRHQNRHDVTVDSITAELEESRQLATAVNQHSAAITASMGKAKLHGLITDKNEHAGPNGGPIKTESVSLSLHGDLQSKSLDELTRLFTEKMKG